MKKKILKDQDLFSLTKIIIVNNQIRNSRLDSGPLVTMFPDVTIDLPKKKREREKKKTVD